MATAAPSVRESDEHVDVAADAPVAPTAQARSDSSTEVPGAIAPALRSRDRLAVYVLVVGLPLAAAVQVVAFVWLATRLFS